MLSKIELAVIDDSVGAKNERYNAPPTKYRNKPTIRNLHILSTQYILKERKGTVLINNQ